MEMESAAGSSWRKSDATQIRWNASRKSSQTFEQLCQFNLEALGKLLHAEKRQVALSAFYLPDVRPMQADLLFCSLLRPAPRVPQFADPLAEGTF